MRWGRVVGCAVVMLFAQRAAADEDIVLRDGSTVRGVRVDLPSNETTRVRLRSGLIKEICTRDIADVAPARRELPDPAPRETFVHLGIRARPTVLQRLLCDGTWEDYCKAPCSTTADVRDTYRVDGPGLRSTHAFKLHDAPLNVVNVTPRTNGALVGGALAIAAGSLVLPPAVVGAALFGVMDAAICGGQYPSADCSAFFLTLMVSSITLAAGSIVAIAFGGWIVSRNGSSPVTLVF